MIKWQDLVLSSPAGILSIHAQFVSKRFTYLLQAVSQSKLRTSFRSLLSKILKELQTTFRSISWQWILPLENERRSRAQLARQRTWQRMKQEQSCFLNQPSTGTKAPQKQPGAPGTAHYQRGPRQLSQETMVQLTVVPVSPSTFGASALQGKSALGSTFHHHFWIFPGMCFDGPWLMPKHPSPAADTPALGRWGGQQHRPTVHEFSKRIHWWKLKASCKVRLWSTVGESVQMFSCSFTKLHHVTINCESASFTWAARGLPPR